MLQGLRIGFGYDVHQLQENRKLILGGVHVPYHKGCLGHSDGDVVIHAICDALLGAANLGDIGQHFPDTDAAYKNIDSRILLEKVMKLLEHQNYQLVNLDTTICLQQPKLKDFIPQMQESLASIMKCTTSQISIKATTTEKMGFVGESKGISCYATVLINQE